MNMDNPWLACEESNSMIDQELPRNIEGALWLIGHYIVHNIMRD